MKIKLTAGCKSLVAALALFLLLYFGLFIPSDAQMVAQYGFEGNVSDTSGNGLNGTNNGVTYTTGVIGGQAGVFNGSSAYVDLGDNTTSGPLKPALPVTVSAWIYLNASGVYQRIFSSDNDDNTSTVAGYSLSVTSSNQLECFYGDAGGSGSTHDRVLAGSATLATGQWYHVAAVIQGATNMQLYVNGRLINGNYSGSGGTMAYTTTTSKIGTGNTTDYFNGYIDDLRVYQSALTASQVSLVAQGLLAYWGFDEGTGTTTADATGDGLTGTLVNSPTWVPNGSLGDALQFNGSNNYVNLGNATKVNPLKPTLPVSVAAWINLASTSSYQRIFSSDNTDNSTVVAGYCLSVNSSGVLSCFYGDAAGSGSAHLREKTGTTTLSPNTWYYVSGVINGPTDMHLYINGVDDGGTYSGTGGAMAYTTTSSKVATANSSYWLNGTVDEVSVANMALTPYQLGAPETIGGGAVSSPAVGPPPSYGVGGAGFTLVKNWHFGTDGTITDGTDLDNNFQYHDEFGTTDNGGNYGAVMVASSAATATITGQRYVGDLDDGVPVPQVRSFTTDSMQTYLVPLGGVTTVTPSMHNCGCGSFQPKWNLSAAGSNLGQDILWETRVRYYTPPYFWFAIWACCGAPYTTNEGPEMDLLESFGYNNGGGSTNYVGNFWHSNSVGGPDQVGYSNWGNGMSSVGINSFDATQYHIWTLLYRKNNTYTFYVDGTPVQYGGGSSPSYFWNNGQVSTGAAAAMYFRFDGGLGATNVSTVNYPTAASALPTSSIYYEWNYSRVYLR